MSETKTPPLPTDLVREIEAALEHSAHVVRSSLHSGLLLKGVIDIGIPRSPRLALGRLVALASVAILDYNGETPPAQSYDTFSRQRDAEIHALFMVLWCGAAAVDASKILDAHWIARAVSGLCDDRGGFAQRCWHEYGSDRLAYALWLASKGLDVGTLDTEAPRAPEGWEPDAAST